MHLSSPTEYRKPESTIALINVVFLMLIFFLVAGTLVSQLDKDVDLATARLAEMGEPPAGALFIAKTGELRFQGQATNLDGFLLQHERAHANGKPVLIAADHRAEAKHLVDVLAGLKTRGVSAISVVTRRP